MSQALQCSCQLTPGLSSGVAQQWTCHAPRWKEQACQLKHGWCQAVHQAGRRKVGMPCPAGQFGKASRAGEGRGRGEEGKDREGLGRPERGCGAGSALATGN